MPITVIVRTGDRPAMLSQIAPSSGQDLIEPQIIPPKAEMTFMVHDRASVRVDEVRAKSAE
jgi:hypothetical protein